MKLHLYILPSSGHINQEGAKRAEESFGDIPLQVTKDIGASGLYLITAHYASWFGYIYDNEIISKDLQKALPTLFNHEENDFYVFYRKEGPEDKLSVSKSPRIFRRHVQLKAGLLVPVNPFLKNEYILDGWLKCQ